MTCKNEPEKHLRETQANVTYSYITTGPTSQLTECDLFVPYGYVALENIPCGLTKARERLFSALAVLSLPMLIQVS